MNQTSGVQIIVVKGNKVLLGKGKNSYKSGYYGLPGGRLEHTEKLVDCAKRELLEETGLTAQSLDYVGVVNDVQESFNFIHFVFVCRDYIGIPIVTELEKCEGWEWINKDEIPEKTLLSHKTQIDMYVNPKPPNFRDISSV